MYGIGLPCSPLNKPWGFFFCNNVLFFLWNIDAIGLIFRVNCYIEQQKDEYFHYCNIFSASTGYTTERNVPHNRE